MSDRVDVSSRAPCIAALLLGAALVTFTRSARAQEAAPPPSPPAVYAPPPQLYYAPAPGAPVPGADTSRREPPTAIYDWDPDVPAPAGYKLVDRANGKLLGIGIGLL